jgi:hypothetical protein
MTKPNRTVLAAAVTAAMALTSLSADAFFGPFNFMRGWGGGGPWGWGGYPYYGWGGYPYYGWGGYPYGGWGGYPYGGWGGYPYLSYPVIAAPAVVTAPAASAEK